jgi:4-amino-4-deoxy-L-arabinose transferase-like glycosyltransferase
VRVRSNSQAALLITLLVLAGLALRLILLVEAHWRFDYDEGMVGLQVRHILQGERPIFHPGQPYLGVLESYLIAPLFLVFGSNAVTLKIVPWLLSGVYVGTTGWLGWRVFDRQVGVLSALLAALAPSYLLVVGMKAWGATAETLVLGNLALILTTYAVDPDSPHADRALILLGLIGGIAFWVSWLIAFYAVPILIVLAWRGRSALRRVWWAAGLAFLAGSAPFWWYNVAHPLATFRYLFSDQSNTWGNAGAVLDHLNYDLSPRLVSGDPKWHLLSWPAIWWLQLVYEGGLIGLIVWVWRGPWSDARRPARALLGLFAVGLPVIYVISGYGNHALNEFGFDATGRYVLMIHSALPIGAAALCIALKRAWRHFPAAAILTSVIALNLLGAARIDPTLVFTSPYYTRQPTTLQPLIDFLDQQGIRDVWTDVGIAHVLMFETNERILAADWYDIYGAKGIVRFPDVPLEIAQAARVAYVEVILPGQTNTRFEQAFEASGVPFAVYHVPPDLLVIIPLAPLDPAHVGDGLGYQF